MEGRANKLASGADGRTSGTAVWVGTVRGGGCGAGVATAPVGQEGVKRRRAVPADRRDPLGNLPSGLEQRLLPSAQSPVKFSFSCLGLERERGQDWDRVRAGLRFCLLSSGRIWCFQVGVYFFRRWKLRFTLASFPSLSICLPV